MSIDGMSRSERRAAKREATVAAVIDKEMNDVTWNRLRTRPARRSLVVAWLSITLVIAVAWPAGVVGYVGLPAVAVWITVFYFLRRSVRALADTPDEYLDERQIAVRDRVYLHAYRIFALGMLMILFAATVAVDRYEVGYDGMSGVMWLAIGISMGLPSAILAWNTADT